MQHINKLSDSAHQELSQLLPWYVNKTLQRAEQKEVEKHLTVCLTCKRELIQLQKLAQAVIQEGSLDSAEQASFSRLKKRLHSGQQLDLQSLPQQARPEKQQISVAGNVSQLGDARKQGWKNSAIPRPALAMATALLLSLSVLMSRHAEIGLQQENNFRTLSDAQPETINANEIRVVFAEGVNQQQKNKILGLVHGQYVGNPTAQGVHTIRLANGIAPKQLLDVIELLRKDSNIIFAEPAYALLSSMQTEKSR
jgi:hypothetical protein